MIKAMRDLTAGVFEHLYTTYKLGVYQGIKYTELILKLPEPNKYYASFLACKEMAKGFSVNQWNFGSAEDISMEDF